MSRPSLLAALLLSLACAKEIPDPGGSEIDFSSPKSVVSHIFWAAENDDPRQLASLCSRAGVGNSAVERVCAVTAASDDWDSFRINFARGILNGEPRIAGDRAVLKFLYGPEGAEPETMKLIRENDRWVLEGF